MDKNSELEKEGDAFSSLWFKFRWLFVLFLLVSLAIWVMNSAIEGQWDKLFESPRNVRTFFMESLWPPDWSVLEPRAYPVCERAGWLDFTCSTAWIGVMETIKIAFSATVFGMLISYPIALLAADNLNSNWISYPARFFLAACRSLPSILWAVLFVIMVGLGPMAGIMAMTIYTVGYLGKLQYETIEGVAKPQLDASKAMGHGWLERSFGVVLPEAANGLISQAIFMFEYNFRARYSYRNCWGWWNWLLHQFVLRIPQYDKVFAYVIVIFVVVLILDTISKLTRSLFNDEKYNKRHSWWSIFLPAAMVNHPEEK